jgi:hypothetical protein
MAKLNRKLLDKLPVATYSRALSGCSFAGSKYGAQERILVVAAYLIHGSVTKASETTGIPKTTIRDWQNTEWWAPLSDEVRAEKENEFRAGFTRIIESALGQIEDRLTHGDVKLVKTKDGYEQRRVPVSARDATLVEAINYDKLRLSLNMPTSITAASTQKSVTQLSDEFRKIAREYKREIIDVTPDPKQH